MGNGRRFVDQHGSNVCYVRPWGKWLYWNGAVWTEEGAYDHVMRLAMETVRSLAKEAYELADEDARKRMLGHAKRSGDVRALKGMLESAQSEEGVGAQPKEFDQDPWLLCSANGTIDLRTGDCLPHSGGHLITKMIPVEYDPEATFPLWDEFLERMVPDESLRNYLQRAIGWTITGDKGEEKLFFVYGPTSSGKSTFLEAMLSVLGPYATTADFKMLLERKYDSGPHPDLARHVGSRMIVAQEVNENRRFDSAAMKVMVSCNPMVAKRLYKDPFEFVPQWKVWLAANSQPRIDADDKAAWRRIKVIPFTVTLPVDERKKEVKATLATDPRARAAILAWAVRGCLLWQKDGLDDVEAVAAAGHSYRDANDEFSDFFEEHYELDAGGVVPAATIRSAYEAYCEEHFKRPMHQNVLAEKLKSKGLKPDQIGPERTRVWKGLRERRTARTA
jgi:putative DNA primase/helicase